MHILIHLKTNKSVLKKTNHYQCSTKIICQHIIKKNMSKLKCFYHTLVLGGHANAFPLNTCSRVLILTSLSLRRWVFDYPNGARSPHLILSKNINPVLSTWIFHCRRLYVVQWVWFLQATTV